MSQNNSIFKGSVGINTINPIAELDVNGMITGGNLNIDSQYPQNNILLSKLANTGKCMIAWNRSGGWGETDLISNRGEGSQGGFNFYDYTNDGILNHLVRFDGGGNIGIGTATPITKLQIGNPYPGVASGWSNSARQGILIGQDTDNMYVGLIDEGSNAKRAAIVFGDDSTDYFRILRNDSGGSLAELLRIQYNGNVGIGVSSPSEKLEVDGTIKSNSNLVIGSGSAGNRYIIINNASNNKPQIRYNDTDWVKKWEYTDDGVHWNTFTHTNLPFWYKTRINYFYFNGTDPYQFYTVPPGGIIHAIKIKHDTCFTGTSGGTPFSSFKVSIGIYNDYQKYTNPYEVGSNNQVANNTFYLRNGLFAENTAGWPVYIKGYAYDNNNPPNLYQYWSLESGNLDVWLLISIAD